MSCFSSLSAPRQQNDTLFFFFVPKPLRLSLLLAVLACVSMQKSCSWLSWLSCKYQHNLVSGWHHFNFLSAGCLTECWLSMLVWSLPPIDLVQPTQPDLPGILTFLMRDCMLVFGTFVTTHSHCHCCHLSACVVPLSSMMQSTKQHDIWSGILGLILKFLGCVRISLRMHSSVLAQ